MWVFQAAGCPEARQAADSRGDDVENAAAQSAAAETVPQPRRARKAPEPRKSRRKTAQAEPEGAAAKKAQPAAKKDEPPLRVVILEVLTQHHEPRLVREIAQEVKQAQPDRDPSDQAVRNSLNTLIAKGQVEARNRATPCSTRWSGRQRRSPRRCRSRRRRIRCWQTPDHSAACCADGGPLRHCVCRSRVLVGRRTHRRHRRFASLRPQPRIAYGMARSAARVALSPQLQVLGSRRL
jgi:hypothetical protein